MQSNGSKCLSVSQPPSPHNSMSDQGLARTTAATSSSPPGKAEILIQNIAAMKLSENSSYSYSSYLKEGALQLSMGCDDSKQLSLWREKLCSWTYDVVDHFKLSRRTVAVSMNIFDRFLATIGNQCDGNQALLISLGTLYISIKIHERKRMKLWTMSDLSRNQFSPKEIGDMELHILHNIRWLAHPPVPLDFISVILKFLPMSVAMPVRYQIFELARYLIELSVCDKYFVDLQSSSAAFAAILNVLEDHISYETIPKTARDSFFVNLYFSLQFDKGDPKIKVARCRLRCVLSASRIYPHNSDTKSSFFSKSGAKDLGAALPELLRNVKNATGA